MNTIAIAGVGLIGGSLALAVRKAGWQGRILGVSSPRTIESALQNHVIDEGATIEEAADRADIIYLSQPISVILETLNRLARIARPGCLITDAGSTKAEIVSRAAEVLPSGVQFLGGHPMAGKEARGVQSADADLFRDRTYVFTPTSSSDLQTPNASAFIALTESVGALPLILDAAEHDRRVALTSHLPQLASTALASTVGSELLTDEELSVSGPGFQDQTRLALSSWDIWSDIVRTNTTFIDHALGVYIDKLTEMRENLRTQRIGEEFALAAEVASRVRRLGGQKQD
jgi:prephenate dehydrogenase